MNLLDEENAPLDYTAVSSVREGENPFEASHPQKENRRVERIVYPEDYRKPGQAFLMPKEDHPAQPHSPAVSNADGASPSHFVSSDVPPQANQTAEPKSAPAHRRREHKQNTEISEKDGSCFSPPLSPEIPDWLRISQGNPMPSTAQSHPRVQSASAIPYSENFSEGFRPNEKSRQYVLSGYPREILEDAQRKQAEEAAQSMRKSHGARETLLIQTRTPEKPSSPNREPAQAAVPDAPVSNEKKETPAKKKSFFSLPFVSLILLLVSVAFTVFAYGKGFYIEKKLEQLQQEKLSVAQALKKAHPIKYRELIELKAEKYGLVPSYVAAIILNESSYDPDATSTVGARGLMQLMDDTAEWIWKKVKPEGKYSFDLLYGEDLNLEFGCWYLNYLSGLFRGDPILVTAAFHAGQNEVRNWLANREYSSDGIHISLEKLPEGPTKAYVRRVLRDYAVYQDFYASSEV